MFPEKIDIAVNTIKMFINHQKPNGQLPCFILGGKLPGVEAAEKIGYSQIQECLSFYRLALMVCRMTNDRELLQLCYDSGKKWDSWLRKWRMTENLGLIETFMGFDIGHDNSGRYFKYWQSMEGSFYCAERFRSDKYKYDMG